MMSDEANDHRHWSPTAYYNKSRGSEKDGRNKVFIFEEDWLQLRRR